MQLTQEQNDIIHSSGNIKINAVAGSGKTTTIVEYARTRPNNSKILYLVFNKSVKMEAIKKFYEKGISNVTVETAHSLAYKHIVPQHKYRVRPQGYKTHEIASTLHLKGNNEKLTEYIIANHINKFVAYFCNSNALKVSELNYLDVVSDKKAQTFVQSCYHYIETQTRILMAKMDKGEIEITHDFYLKKFQLSNPQLNYDYILFDEGQDASPAMLDVFLKQKAVKVIVGDTHQQIYGWRFAINSLEKADFKTYNLSTSFRFDQSIANLAMEILKWKNYLTEIPSVQITGKGTSKEKKTKAILARTNLGLLLKAIEYTTEKENIKKLYFEGNIHSYTYADDGASLYDVLNLYNGNRRLIKDSLIKAMKNFFELEDYIEKTEDTQLGMLVEIVKEYGSEIPGIIQSIKDKHVSNEDKESADVIFSTVHRCKGMEYDTVQIINDFITEEKIKKLKETNQLSDSIPKLNEEINLLYVAITRAKHSIYIPEALMPKNFASSPHMHILNTQDKENKKIVSTAKPMDTPIYKIDLKEVIHGEIRANHKDAYRPWTTELDEELTIMYCEGVSVKDMSKHFRRTKGAIQARIEKLELKELYG